MQVSPSSRYLPSIRSKYTLEHIDLKQYQSVFLPLSDKVSRTYCPLR
jgi:hypothetical protein